MQSLMAVLETDNATLSIRPTDVQAVETINNIFSKGAHSRLNSEARWILGLCQEKGNWNPFTVEELAHYCHTIGMDGLESNKVFNTYPLEWSALCKEGWIIHFDKYYFLTWALIEKFSGYLKAT